MKVLKIFYLVFREHGLRHCVYLRFVPNVNTFLLIRITNNCRLVFLLSGLLFYSCNPTRKLKEGQYLMNEVKIQEKEGRFQRSEIEPYIKPKPNRKIFGFFRFHLGLYNLANEEKVKRKAEAFAAKREAENLKR